MLKRVLIVLLVSGFLAGLLFLGQMRTEPDKVSGIVEAEEVQLGSLVGGRVLEVNFEEGDRVDGGEVLVRLEPFDLTAQREEAEAQLHSRKAELAKLRSGMRPEEIRQAESRRARAKALLQKMIEGPRPEEIAQSRANLEAAGAALKLAEHQHRRMANLVEDDSAPVADLDQAVKELQSAESMVAARRAALDLLLAGTREEEIAEARAQFEETEAAVDLRRDGYREEDIEAAGAAVGAAKAMLEKVNQRIEELKITAPANGRIESLDLHPGDLIAPASPGITLLRDEPLHIRAFLPEAMSLEVGQKIEISVDTLPGKRFPAKVDYISDHAEFTPSNVQTPEERQKLVFLFKAILIDPPKEIRPGMYVDVWLDDSSSSGDEVAP